jgi:hypothetical protein
MKNALSEPASDVLHMEHCPNTEGHNIITAAIAMMISRIVLDFQRWCINVPPPEEAASP